MSSFRVGEGGEDEEPCRLLRKFEMLPKAELREVAFKFTEFLFRCSLVSSSGLSIMYSIWRPGNKPVPPRA
ncbi:hypothetical protein [Rubritalea tangerina]|uniref:hypothetical protein n=1 Tax=Rubritalea tangerina TaxID=430798 RepID=UPI00361694B5